MHNEQCHTYKHPRTTHPWIAEGQETIRFGTAIMSPPRQTPEAWSELIQFVREVEDLGFDSYWVPDHPVYYVDLWATLASLAVSTRRSRLGSWVSCVYYRHPIQLARAAADVDRLSGGRLILGVGNGDIAYEFQHLGLTFAKPAERGQVLEETVHIVAGLLSGQTVTHAGKFFQIQDVILPLGPVETPRIPLLIGGGGERVTLRQVAQYADMSNFGEHEYIGSVRTFADVSRKLEALDRHCSAFGRDPATVLRSHTTFPLVLAETPAALARKVAAIPQERRDGTIGQSWVAATVSEAIAYYTGLIEAGLRYFIASVWGADIDTLRLLAERVIPELR